MSSSQASLFEDKALPFDEHFEKCLNMYRVCEPAKHIQSQGATLFRGPDGGFDYTCGLARIVCKRNFTDRDFRLTAVYGRNGFHLMDTEQMGFVYTENPNKIDRDKFIPKEAFDSTDIFNYEMKLDIFIPVDKDIFFELLNEGKWFGSK